MNQIYALRELADRVEAGKVTEKFSPLFERAFYAGGEDMTLQVYPASDACFGSLDAAHSLHKAVLGDRWKYKIDFSGRVFVEINDQTRITSGYIDGSPARAWLLAVIRAKISELGDVL